MLTEKSVQRTLCFRLYPTSSQSAIFGRQLDLTRRLYNACLEQRITAYRLGVKVPREYDQNLQLREVRAAMPEYKAIPAGVLFAIPKRVERAFQNFFRGDAGFPKFKGKSSYTSITHLSPLPPHGHGTYRLESRRLSITRVGGIRHQASRPAWLTPEAMPKTLTVKRIAGRWNARIVFEVPDVMKPSAPVNSGVGLDAGLAHLWSDDQGNHYDNPRWLQANLRRLRRKQRVVSRRKKGSAGRKKAALVVARLHERVANQRLDYYHKLTRIIASTNALVAVEDNLAGLRRSRLARNVHDAAWSTLHRLLEYKLPEHGGRLVKVDPRGTSKTCSGCGGPVVEEPGRQVRCNTTCGQTLDRDTNAARNILARARQAVPPDGREFTPVKTGSPLTVAQAAVDVPVNEAGTVDTGHHTAGSVTL